MTRYKGCVIIVVGAMLMLFFCPVFGQEEMVAKESQPEEQAVLQTASMETSPALMEMSADQCYWKGVQAIRDGKNRIAVVAFSTVLAKDPTYAKAHYQIARALISMNRIEEAALHAAKAVDLLPDNGSAHRTMGRVQRLQGDLNGAMMSFEKACELEPKVAWNFNNLGLVYIEMGRFEDAKKALQEAVSLDDSQYVMFNNLGVACMRTDDPEGAIKAFERVLELKPDFAPAKQHLETLKAQRAAEKPVSTPKEVPGPTEEPPAAPM
jgi:tetratricopeptide (TPR) repeat protein